VDDISKATAGGAGFYISHAFTNSGLVYERAAVGDFAGAGAAIDAAKPYLSKLAKLAPGSHALAIVDAFGKISVAFVAFERDDFATTKRILDSVEADIGRIRASSGVDTAQTSFVTFFTSDFLARSAYELRDYGVAEQAEQRAIAARRVIGDQSVPDRRQLGGATTWLAMAQARQGKSAEATQTITPVVKFYRELQARNHGDQWVPIELAGVLYAQALVDKAHAPALLHEAAALIDAAPATIRSVQEVQRWRARIAAEQSASHS
jgi:hypothetical protein